MNGWKEGGREGGKPYLVYPPLRLPDAKAVICRQKDLEGEMEEEGEKGEGGREGGREEEFEQVLVRRKGGREGGEGRARTLPGAIGVFLEAADAEATQGIHHAQGVDDLMVMQGREPGKGRVERDGRRRRGEGRREGGKKGTRWQ